MPWPASVICMRKAWLACTGSSVVKHCQVSHLHRLFSPVKMRLWNAGGGCLVVSLFVTFSASRHHVFWWTRWKSFFLHGYSVGWCVLGFSIWKSFVFLLSLCYWTIQKIFWLFFIGHLLIYIHVAVWNIYLFVLVCFAGSKVIACLA